MSDNAVNFLSSIRREIDRSLGSVSIALAHNDESDLYADLLEIYDRLDEVIKYTERKMIKHSKANA